MATRTFWPLIVLLAVFSLSTPTFSAPPTAQAQAQAWH